MFRSFSCKVTLETCPWSSQLIFRVEDALFKFVQLGWDNARQRRRSDNCCNDVMKQISLLSFEDISLFCETESIFPHEFFHCKFGCKWHECGYQDTSQTIRNWRKAHTSWSSNIPRNQQIKRVFCSNIKAKKTLELQTMQRGFLFQVSANSLQNSLLFSLARNLMLMRVFEQDVLQTLFFLCLLSSLMKVGQDLLGFVSHLTHFWNIETFASSPSSLRSQLEEKKFLFEMEQSAVLEERFCEQWLCSVQILQMSKERLLPMYGKKPSVRVFTLFVVLLFVEFFGKQLREIGFIWRCSVFLFSCTSSTIAAAICIRSCRNNQLVALHPENLIVAHRRWQELSCLSYGIKHEVGDRIHVEQDEGLRQKEPNNRKPTKTRQETWFHWDEYFFWLVLCPSGLIWSQFILSARLPPWFTSQPCSLLKRERQRFPHLIWWSILLEFQHDWTAILDVN